MAEEPRRLTLNDPVPPDQIKLFAEIAEGRATIAEQLLKLEQDKIWLLASAKQLDDQHRRLFQGLLTERGVAPGTRCGLDAKSGKLELEEEPLAPETPQSPPADKIPAEPTTEA